MAYTKTNWVDGTTPITATELNRIEQGIEDAHKGSISQTATGTGTAIILTGVNFVDGFTLNFIIANDNNALATTVNGKPLYKPATTEAPNLKAGKNVSIWYNAGGDCFFFKASAEGDATATHVLAGKKFSNDDDTGIVGTMVDFVGATLDVQSGGNIVSTVDDPLYPNLHGIITVPTVANGRVSTSTMVQQRILNLAKQNIKAGVVVGGNSGAGMVGTFTSDANAVASNILSGKTAYVNASKVTGTMPNKLGVINAEGVAKWGDGALAVYPSEGYYKGGAGDGEIKVSVPQLQSVNGDFIATNIKVGKNIFGVNGTFTSDATASAGQILSGQSAYVNSSKIIGTMPNKTGGYTTDSLTHSGNELRMSVDSAGYFTDGAYLKHIDNDWVESNIKSGVDVFGKTGNYSPVSVNVVGTDRLYLQTYNNNGRHELNPSLSIIKSYTGEGFGIGGTCTELYTVEKDSQYVYIRNPDTLAYIKSGRVSPSRDLDDVGGMSSRAFCGEEYGDTLIEFHPTTLVAIKEEDHDVYGIGGTVDRLYRTTSTVVHEINPDTLATIYSHSTPSGSSSYKALGIGGMGNRLYLTESGKGAYEINPNTLVQINHMNYDFNSYVKGIGGMKSESRMVINEIIGGITEPSNITYNSKLYRQ